MIDEQKAKRRAWAESHFGDRNLTDEELGCATYMPSENFSDGWDKGVDFALSHQWISVEERLPEDNTLVVVWVNSTILTDFCEKGEWHHYGVRFWLPIPKLNPEKQSI